MITDMLLLAEADHGLMVPHNEMMDMTAEGATALSVENPGRDIAPEHLPRLFDRFYQVDPSRQHSREGAGLGLAITQSIAQAHRATLQVTSSNGKTRFGLVFAHHDPAASTPAAGSDTPPIALAAGTCGPQELR